MLLNIALVCLVVVISQGNALKPPFPDPIEKVKLAGDNSDAGTSTESNTGDTEDLPATLQTPSTKGGSSSNAGSNDGDDSVLSGPGPVTSTDETSHTKIVPGSKKWESTSQSSQTPSPTPEESDTLLDSSPRSKGHQQSVGANAPVNTPESSPSSSGDASSTVDINQRKHPSIKPRGVAPVAPASQSSTNPSGPGASLDGSVSVAVPNPCDNLPAGADNTPFSCYDQRKLKDYCTQTFGTGAQPVPVNSGNQQSGFKRYVVDTTTKANWYQALGLCQSRNMSLATVESFDDQKAMATVLNSAGGVQNAWLSAADLGQINHYVWMSTGQPVSWTNWYDGEPNHESSGNETEHCIEVINYRWKWNDNLCDNQEYFVCQYFSDN